MTLPPLLLLAAVLGLMPSLPLENLRGERVVTPGGISIDFAIYVITFTRDASAQGSEWSTELRKAFPHQKVVQVAIIDDVPGFARSFVVKQIRSGVPENMRGNFFVAKEKGEQWKKLVSFTRPEVAYVIIAAPQGEIRWRSSGKFDAELAALMSLQFQKRYVGELLTMPTPNLSTTAETITEYDPADPTNAVFFLDRNNWLLGVVYTKIRGAYPKSFAVIELNVLRTQRQMERRYGRDTYAVDVLGNGEERYLLAVNRRPGFSGRSDIEFFRHSSGDFDPENRCGCVRADLHFVRSGYYVQVVSIVNTKTGLTREQALKNAQSLADNARVGLRIK